MTKKAVMIGLDGAAWHLLDPLFEQGVMPRLEKLRAKGASGTLSSTVPTYTPPAWTSAATGVNPGRHGVYGFHSSHAQHDRMQLVHSGKVRSATIWEMANAQGASIGVYNLPLTYPPQRLDNGWMVSGMMTPSYGERVKGFAYPAALEQEILSWAPGYEVDIKTHWDDDYKNDALCRRALRSLKQRRTVLEALLSERQTDLVFSVIEAPDRLQHAYYKYMDPRDEMFSSEKAQSLRPAIAECFQLMDEIVGLLEDYAGTDGGVVVCSDHGFTGWDCSVHTNALLEQWGYLKFKATAKLMQTSAARALVPVAKRVLPAKSARAAKSKTFSAIDWANTRAFASPIPQQGVFVNVVGREPLGIVPEKDVAGIVKEIAQRFAELRGPDGKPATDRVHLAEDVFHGDSLEGAPDLLPVLRDHRFELDDEIFHKEPFTDMRRLPRGVHHMHGIGIYAGAGVNAASGVDASVLDVTPTLLYLAGMKVPDDLDGSVVKQAFDPHYLEAHPIESASPLESGKKEEASPYSAEEEAEIEEALRGLGYL
ncbi:MAG: alkaline phosphatase family protein [Actinomycetota bacterium]|nr:alkaline phosphatase family protein [Actinomycetota bacterium]